jgi:hypothetical protein
MDTKEASAMTEASGLTDDQDLENPPRRTQASRNETQLRSPLRLLTERLRKMTLEAPLRSLFLAFILGAWVARRR